MLDSDWHAPTIVTVALVPVRLIVCWLLAPSLLTVRVATSFVPADWLGVNLKIMVQLEPLATSRPLEHVPKPVLAKSAVFAPVIVK